MSLAQLTDWCTERFGEHSIESDLTPRPFDVPWLVMDNRQITPSLTGDRSAIFPRFSKKLATMRNVIRTGSIYPLRRDKPAARATASSTP